ncbi:hypothetical protein C7M84_014646 [Penaeus vannamei]|uniref:Uncharacterized protein n=1 Tax=Penaeus vannamei TaxID=6689 RepID=A0A3R7PI34_PENVA|nr:hypothetical protein C7M84_014646 [Penaeus vannamei]
MWKLPAVTLFVLATSLSVGAEAPEGQATQIVLEKLRDKENYNSAVRPSPHGDPTEVKVQMYIREIDVDDANMKADFDLTFRMESVTSTSSRLTWPGCPTPSSSTPSPRSWSPSTLRATSGSTRTAASSTARGCR